jgi:hypothetical protein
VRVLQARDELNLPMETIETHARGQIGGKELDHDLPIETSLGSKKDVTHPPTAKLAFDGVRIAKSGLKPIAEFRQRCGRVANSGTLGIVIVFEITHGSVIPSGQES